MFIIGNLLEAVARIIDLFIRFYMFIIAIALCYFIQIFFVNSLLEIAMRLQ